MGGCVDEPTLPAPLPPSPWSPGEAEAVWLPVRQRVCLRVCVWDLCLAQRQRTAGTCQGAASCLGTRGEMTGEIIEIIVFLPEAELKCGREHNAPFPRNVGLGLGRDRLQQTVDREQLSHPDSVSSGVMGIIVLIGVERWL